MTLAREGQGPYESRLHAAARPADPAASIHDLTSASRSSQFQPGEILLDRFRIVKLIGRGGMGEVFEAEDLQLGRIALKTIRAEIATSPFALERFRREVQLARKVSGPQVCRIHELFLTPGTESRASGAFLTMEFLDGATLSNHLRQSGPLSRVEAGQVALDICAGLTLIHHQGIVHRDLKCSNIMLCERAGRLHAVLTDFGLASEGQATAGPDDSTATTVRPGSVKAMAGTPAYMAPEQFEGKSVSPPTDIYALGVVFYEMLTGLQPYAANTPVGAAIRRAQHPRPVSTLQRGVPRRWDHIIARCLEYEPERRFQSADEVASALKSSPLQWRNMRVDHPRLVWLAATALFAVLAWAGVAWWQTLQYDHPGAEAERWYQTGLAALREASYLKATRALSSATARDGKFVMAHARLAEAWANLDFDGTAQQEMLIASAGERRVPPLDRMYLDAIRSTLTRDFSGALKLYRQILDRLPFSQKAAGHVDLGMAYERAGDPQQALKEYEAASSLNPDNPAPYLRSGILESRLNQVPQATRDFGRAESLYTSEINPEGLAELDYQRGYLANQRESNDEANTYLNRALGDAQRLPSVQLEIRALTQLSSVAYNSAHDTQAVELAQRAIQLARDNQLDGWAAEGFVRLANVRLVDQQYPQADDALRDAFQILKQSRQTRVEAMANFTLASLRYQEHRSNEVLIPATAALAYYKANGHFFDAARSSLLIARAERSQGEFAQALQSGNELADLAMHAGNQGLQTQAEELLGSVYLGREDYPAALEHFRKAASLAGTGPYEPYEAVHVADVLARMGRFAESVRMLAAIPPSNSSAGEIRVTLLLAQQHYARAALLAKTVLRSPEMPSARVRGLELDLAIAEAHAGKAAAAFAEAQVVLAQRIQVTDPGELASLDLSVSQVYLAVNQPTAALDAAVKAEAYFKTRGCLDSWLRSSLLEEAAAKRLSATAADQEFIAKSIDILRRLGQTWPPEVISSYISRPDIHSALRNVVPAPK